MYKVWLLFFCIIGLTCQSEQYAKTGQKHEPELKSQNKPDFKGLVVEKLGFLSEKVEKVKNNLLALYYYCQSQTWDDLRAEWTELFTKPDFHKTLYLISTTSAYFLIRVHNYVVKFIELLSTRVLNVLKNYYDSEHGKSSPYNPWTHVHRYRKGDDLMAFFVRTASLSLLPIIWFRCGISKVLLFTVLFSIVLRLYGYESVFYLYIIALSPLYVVISETIKKPILLLFGGVLLFAIRRLLKNNYNNSKDKELNLVYNRLEVVERHIKLLSDKIKKLERK